MLERILSFGFERLKLVPSGSRREGRTRSFADRNGARTFVEHVLREPNGADQLRLVLRDFDPAAYLSRDDDDAIVERVTALFYHGRIAILEAPRDTHVEGGEEKGEPQAAEQPVRETTWVAFEIHDDATDDPVAGVKVSIKLPNAGLAPHTTPGSGVLDFDPCDRGSCLLEADFEGHDVGTTLELVGVGLVSMRPDDGVPFPNPKGKPYAIATVRRHRVRSDDTLKSIAEGAGMTWQDLAKFNFGTADPDAINKALHSQVGCRKKTKDRKNYVFGDSDEPGIIYVPGKISRQGFSTGLTHTLRVRHITRPSRPFVFSY